MTGVKLSQGSPEPWVFCHVRLKDGTRTSWVTYDPERREWLVDGSHKRTFKADREDIWKPTGGAPNVTPIAAGRHVDESAECEVDLAARVEAIAERLDMLYTLVASMARPPSFITVNSSGGCPEPEAGREAPESHFRGVYAVERFLVCGAAMEGVTGSPGSVRELRDATRELLRIVWKILTANGALEPIPGLGMAYERASAAQSEIEDA